MILHSNFTYEDYCKNHSIPHLWLAFLLCIPSGIGLYHIFSLLTAINQQLPITIKQEMVGMTAACIGLPIILWLETLFRSGTPPSKKLLTILIVLYFSLLIIFYQFSLSLTHSYLHGQNYQLCKEYQTKGKNRYARQEWQYQSCHKKF